MDGALPFGLRSAPKLFTAVADALLWIIGSHGVREGIHYLDDFLILGRAGTEECSEGLERSLQLCKNLGVTVAPQKTEGPATALSFLGICLDTDEMIIKLPQEKLTRLRSLITEWKGRRTCCKRDLLSLIGQLQHACKVVRAVVLEAHDRSINGSVEASPPYSPQPRLPIRPSVVGYIPS